jgi:hypothetical protein
MLMVEMLARMPDLRRRIQAEHIADSSGRCRDCHGAQWPCELYRLAIEVDRRYGPCPSNAGWPGPPRQTQHGAVPPQSLSGRPGPPVGRGTPPTPPQGARRPGAPVAPLPAGVTPLPPSRTRTPGRPSGRAGEAGVALPAPRPTTTGNFAAVQGAPRTPTALSARHDELRARREQHRARRDELRARRGEVERWRDGGRHDLGRPAEAAPLVNRLPPGTVPQPKSELIDVLEDVLRWSQ